MSQQLKQLQKQLTFYETKKKYFEERITKIKEAIGYVKQGIYIYDTGSFKEASKVGTESIERLPRGYLESVVLDILRKNGKPMRCRDIANAAVNAGLSVIHYSQSNSLLSTIMTQLTKLVARGIIQKEKLMEGYDPNKPPKMFYGFSEQFDQRKRTLS